jgi:hypothetical protein
MMPQGEAVNSIQWRWRDSAGQREGTVMEGLRNEAKFSQVVSFSFSWVPNSCPHLTLPA